MAPPSTSRQLPRIEPTSEALTTSWRPSASAKIAMISSGALPKVTFTSPPTPGPALAESCSVASPISAAIGTIASAEAANTTEESTSAKCRAAATGTKTPRTNTGLTRAEAIGRLPRATGARAHPDYWSCFSSSSASP